MATDYSKKTNAELVEVLKARSLPHTGKKAELVARIQEDDEKTTGAPATAPAAASTDAAEDVIDWDDDVPGETTATEQPATEAGANAIAAGGKGAVPNPVAVPNQKLDTDPATTDDLKVESTGEVVAAAAEPVEETEKKPAVDYTRGLPATELEEELRKRKARAEKFGIVEDTETALKEAEKSIARAKRFGAETDNTASASVKGLDQALPDEKSRKRARTEGGSGGQGGQDRQGGRGGKRRDHGRNRGRHGDDQNRRGGNKGASAPGGQKSRNDKDSLALEARKKRFTTAA
ncbi:hypothetical protein N7454_008759 [Penicillium verhagenii]|nr:hypothetical protein N7454_008759 [Penicillium verhagenii]